MLTRIGIGLLGVSVFILSFTYYISTIKEEAFKRGVESVASDIKHKTDFAMKKQDKINYILLEEDLKDIKTVEVIKTEIKTQIKEVTVYVTKEIIVPADCTEFSGDVVWMLSETTSIINNATRRETN